MGYLNRSTVGALVLRNAGDVAVHTVAFAIVFWGLVLASEVLHPAVALVPWLYAMGLPATKAWQCNVEAAIASEVTTARRELSGVLLKWVLAFPAAILVANIGGLLALSWVLERPAVQALPGSGVVDTTWSFAFVPSLVALIVATSALCVFAGGVSLAGRVALASTGDATAVDG